MPARAPIAVQRCKRPRRRGRWLVPAVLVCGALCGVIFLVASSALGDTDEAVQTHHARHEPRSGGGSGSGPRTARRLRVKRLGRLASPVQDAAVAVLGSRVYAFGGLDGSGSSTATISQVNRGSIRIVGRLLVPIHDAAASAIAGRLEIFGGGRYASVAGIATFTPRSGVTRLVGSLPTPLSDLAAASLQGTTYLVGGYTGSAWSNRIYAVHGAGVAPAGRLPMGLRYAAVAPVGAALLIAGGRTPHGPGRAIYRFTPATGHTTRIGTLPRPIMHASAGTLNGVMYILGGITSGGRTVRSVIAVGANGDARLAASLPTPLSDAGVATLPGQLLVLGGTTGRHTVASVLQITTHRVTVKRVGTTPAARPPSRPPAMFNGPLPGDLLIADRGNNRILMVNPKHQVIWRFPNRPHQVRLYFDDDTFFVPGGRAIITNQEENHQIVEVGYPGGRLLWSYGHPGVSGSAPGYLNTPDDAYELSSGMVIVADAYNCRILEIRGHHVVRSIGQAGHCVHDPPRYIGAVNGDTPLPNGHILVSEINGSYLDEFTLRGKLVRVYHAPVAYPSDPQLTLNGNILLADYTSPGGIVILSRRTGRLLWRYRVATGRGRLDHPSLAGMLPNGMIAVNDDYNHRVVIINPPTKRIVWHYGHLRNPGRRHGYLNTPDGFDFVPVTPTGAPDPAAITHGRVFTHRAGGILPG